MGSVGSGSGSVGSVGGSVGSGWGDSFGWISKTIVTTGDGKIDTPLGVTIMSSPLYVPGSHDLISILGRTRRLAGTLPPVDGLNVIQLSA